MRYRINLTPFAVVLGLLLWGCVPSGQKMVLSEKYAEEPTDGSQYLSSRSEAYYHYLKSRQHLHLNSVDEVVAELEMAAAADPDSPQLLIELASFYVRQGQNTKALETAEKARSLAPGSIKGRMLLAGLYSTLKQPDRAIAEYQAVLELEPDCRKF